MQRYAQLISDHNIISIFDQQPSQPVLESKFEGVISAGMSKERFRTDI
jgi:hypothetical protein